MAFSMRSSLQMMAGPTKRCIHTITVGALSRRSFHQTAISSLPRRRHFFTSNQLLSSTESHDHAHAQNTAVTLNEEPKNDGKGRLDSLNQPSKRKTARSSSKNLRQASLTKKASSSGISASRGGTSATDKKARVAEVIAREVDDGVDYRTTIKAVCVAESFDMDLVDEILRYHGFEIDPDGTQVDPDTVIHARSVNNGDIFVFESGTVVAWSVPADTVLKLATQQLIRAAEGPHVDQLEMEDLQFAYDETKDSSYMRGEVVVLGTRGLSNHPSQQTHHQYLQQTLEIDGQTDETASASEKQSELDVTLAKIAFSSGLARSPKLAVLENNMADFIQASKSMSASLADGGSDVSLNRKLILRRTHELLTLRSQLNHYSDLTDPLPDMFWDRESRLEGYYERVGNALDVRSRIAQLNRKIDYAHELVSVFRDMSSERQSVRLEWIIIILISVEVLFELRRVYIDEFGRGAASHVAAVDQ